MASIDELVKDLMDKAEELQTVAGLYDAALSSEKAADEEREKAWRMWQFPQMDSEGVYQNPPERLNEQLRLTMQTGTDRFISPTPQ